MKKLFLAFTAIFLLSGCNQYNQKQALTTKIEVPMRSLKIGFCPTMEKDALGLQKQNANLELVRFASADEVLQKLKTGNINLALIGRKAEKIEIGENIFEKKLENKSYTLIAPQKQMIAEKDLLNLEIKTCIYDEVKNLFPELNLIHKDCNYQNNEIWLISWNDWVDKMNILIPINEKGEKVRKFRSAFLYGENLNNLNL